MHTEIMKVMKESAKKYQGKMQEQEKTWKKCQECIKDTSPILFKLSNAVSTFLKKLAEKYG